MLHLFGIQPRVNELQILELLSAWEKLHLVRFQGVSSDENVLRALVLAKEGGPQQHVFIGVWPRSSSCGAGYVPEAWNIHQESLLCLQ